MKTTNKADRAIIDGAAASNAALAKSAGCANGDYVGVLFRNSVSHAPSTQIAICVDGKLQMESGVSPAPGMITGFATLPFRRRGGDFWTMRTGDVVAVLANGTEVTISTATNVPTFHVGAQSYESILAAALALTPAA